MKLKTKIQEPQQQSEVLLSENNRLKVNILDDGVLGRAGTAKCEIKRGDFSIKRY